MNDDETVSRSEQQTETTWVRLGHASLDTKRADAFLRSPRAGGICLFAGTTRRQGVAESPTTHLAFEAYEPMALKEMRRLVEKAQARWPSLERLVLLHRLGGVPLEEASVITGATAPHRDVAFAACRFLIDRLKERVPIWKREHYADGRARWIEGDAPPNEQDAG